MTALTLAFLIYVAMTGLGAAMVTEDLAGGRVSQYTWVVVAATLATLLLAAAHGYALFVAFDGI